MVIILTAQDKLIEDVQAVIGKSAFNSLEDLIATFFFVYARSTKEFDTLIEKELGKIIEQEKIKD